VIGDWKSNLQPGGGCKPQSGDQYSKVRRAGPDAASRTPPTSAKAMVGKASRTGNNDRVTGRQGDGEIGIVSS